MFHCEQLTGHTAAILEEIHAMVCDGLRWSAMVCDAPKGLKSQENALFYRSVWPGLMGLYRECIMRIKTLITNQQVPKQESPKCI